MVNPEELERANACGLQRLAAGPVAVSARYDKRVHRVVIGLSSGIELGFLPHDAQGLETAKPTDLDLIEISPSGLGLHFPKLDADLYLPALLEGFLGSRHWTAAQLGKKGGSVKSAAKAQAARANGRRGGRPRTARAT
ncbi:MAG: DUF2442 domain-containing protein [Lamprocystis purpurea]|jgi:hypothetical protein|uniref:DUF2442 domain-containing protein n=1 Tax=Lamprocystis purpurea TaxID=61598 RepID=UPI00035CA144|nr:DUF2442 domain-containing protein [Lamprocystis purpurea]MBV5274253.1 DUF2442 domain-containing protein [Lamprocystis purpurea]